MGNPVEPVKAERVLAVPALLEMLRDTIVTLPERLFPTPESPGITLASPVMMIPRAPPGSGARAVRLLLLLADRSTAISSKIEPVMASPPETPMASPVRTGAFRIIPPTMGNGRLLIDIFPEPTFLSTVSVLTPYSPKLPNACPEPIVIVGALL